jgi:hypothetical protein
VKSAYSYRVQDIEFRPGHRGVPHFKMDTGWYLLRSSVELQIVPYVQVGDSIVKQGGSTAIKVIRRAEDGSLITKEFN